MTGARRRARGSIAYWACVALAVTLTAMAFTGTGHRLGAEMVPSIHETIDVSTKNAFDPRPQCRWTDANEVTLTWDADADATSYDVLRSDTFNGSYDSIVNVGAGA